jgi:hypothetical protein
MASLHLLNLSIHVNALTMVTTALLDGELLTLIPWTDEDSLIAFVQPLIPDPNFIELTCGLGVGEDLERFLEVWRAERMSFWYVQPRHLPSPLPHAVAVVSHATFLYRAAFYRTPECPPLPLQWFEDIVDVLSSHVFTTESDAGRIFVHLPLPVDIPVRDMLLSQGFQEWGTNFLNRLPVRAIYGLDRAVHQRYQEAYLPILEDEESLTPSHETPENTPPADS